MNNDVRGFSSSGKREDAEPRGEGLGEILYQAYDLRGFFRFANLLAIVDLRICELANRYRQKKKKKSQIRNSQIAIAEIWDSLMREGHHRAIPLFKKIS